MEFKDRIKQLREEKGLDLTKLAAQFDMKEAGVRAWELGRTKPSVDTLIKLALRFDCTTDYLLGVTDYKNIEDKRCIEDHTENISELKKGLSDKNAKMYRDIEKNILTSFEFLKACNSTMRNELLTGLNLISRVFYFHCEVFFTVQNSGYDSFDDDVILNIAKEITDEIAKDTVCLNSTITSFLDELGKQIVNQLPPYKGTPKSYLDELRHINEDNE